jgi:hypothetical protein
VLTKNQEDVTVPSLFVAEILNGVIGKGERQLSNGKCPDSVKSQSHFSNR